MYEFYGVGLDGVLANTEKLDSDRSIGIPVPTMVARVREWLQQGFEVRIITARAGHPEQIPIIHAWCQRHIGKVLPITNRKESGIREFWDDRVVAVVPNTGQPRRGGSASADFTP